MKNILLKRGLVCGIAILFLGLCITSGTGVNIERTTEQMSRKGELAWWEFDEGSGNTAGDSSGHGYDGTVNGATWTSVGLDFDGTDDYVEFDTHAGYLGMNKTDDYFVYARFQSTGSGMLYSMSHTNPARAYLDLMLDDGGKILVEAGDETCLFDLSSSGTYDDGDWHTVQMEFYGDATNPTLEIYVDGDFEGSITEWLCPMLDEDFLTAKIGRNSNDASDFFDGEIDYVKIYKNYIPGDPPSDPDITGQKNGDVGTAYEYTFTSTDLDGDDVSYYIKWGDGDESGWTALQAEGTPYKEDHTYTTGGIFKILAQAKDATGLTSGWSEYEVKMPRSRAMNFPFLQFLQNHPNLFPILRQLLGL